VAESLWWTAAAPTAWRLLESVARAGRAPTDVELIVLTRLGDEERSGGLGQLAAQCPNAQLLLHPAALGGGGSGALGEELDGVDSLERRLVGAADGALVPLGEGDDAPLKVLQLGSDSLCLWDEVSGAAFVGDAFGVAPPPLVSATGARFVLPLATSGGGGGGGWRPDDAVRAVDRIAELSPARCYISECGLVDARGGDAAAARAAGLRVAGGARLLHAPDGRAAGGLAR